MPFIAEFSKKNPDVNFEVHDGITYTLYDYLQEGIIDISVVRTPLRWMMWSPQSCIRSR